MNKITILLSLIVIGLGFGQSEDHCIRLSEPLRMYLGQEVQDNKIPEQRFSLSNQIASSNYLNPNILIYQVEEDTIQPKTSLCKRVGIYSLECLGAAIGNFPGTWGITCGGLAGELYADEISILALGNSLLGGTTTWLTGKVLSQKGAWWKAALGSGVGTIIGCLMHNRFRDPGNWIFYWPAFYIAPPLGAVIGYNL